MAASELLDKAVGDAPDSIDARNRYGVLLMRMGYMSEAVAKFETGLKMARQQRGRQQKLHL